MLGFCFIFIQRCIQQLDIMGNGAYDSDKSYSMFLSLMKRTFMVTAPKLVVITYSAPFLIIMLHKGRKKNKGRQNKISSASGAILILIKNFASQNPLKMETTPDKKKLHASVSYL